MVSETSLIAKCHQRLAEDLGVSLVDTIKATAARKEEARKKVFRTQKRSLYV